MTEFSFGDIVLVPFPFTDQSTTKKRPAVIVSSNEYNKNRPDIVIMAVTSQIQSPGYYGDVIIEKWRKAGLLKPSVIKPILTTIQKGMVIRILGRTSESDRLAIIQTLQSILGE